MLMQSWNFRLRDLLPGTGKGESGCEGIKGDLGESGQFCHGVDEALERLCC